MKTQSSEGRYSFYEPNVEQYYMYKDHPGCLYEFGHMVSIEHFDGRFHAVWNNHHGAHCGRLYAAQNVARPNQRLLWQTSTDGKHWTEPVRITETSTDTPLDVWTDPHTHWQPNLLNYQNRELWCLWCIAARERGTLETASASESSVVGTYLSVLGPGEEARWRHRLIFGPVDVNPDFGTRGGVRGLLFPSQNPVILSSGRVVQPVTLLPDSRMELGTLEETQYASGVIYSDDDGRTWEMSNFVTNVDDAHAQWEPHVIEQPDGTLRMYIRDLGVFADRDRAITYRSTIRKPLFLTTTGTGVGKGEQVQFDPDPERVWIETESSRMHTIRLSCGRYCMLHHDVWNAANAGVRSNLALFFSRTAANDFVAGPGIAGRSNPAHYAQGIEHQGKLYVGYTRWNTGMRTGGDTGTYEERGIALSIVHPLPEPNRLYLWPRDKDYFSAGSTAARTASTACHYQRPYVSTIDNKRCVTFKERGSAGVDIEPVDFRAAEALRFRFTVWIEEIQTAGNLVLCSFGDRIPLRIGVPGNRQGTCYAYGRDQWRRVGPVPTRQWITCEIVFGADDFSVSLSDKEPKVFCNPVRFPEPRLYLGDGYEVDVLESNRGSVFLVDLDSIESEVIKQTR